MKLQASWKFPVRSVWKFLTKFQQLDLEDHEDQGSRGVKQVIGHNPNDAEAILYLPHVPVDGKVRTFASTMVHPSQAKRRADENGSDQSKSATGQSGVRFWRAQVLWYRIALGIVYCSLHLFY